MSETREILCLPASVLSCKTACFPDWLESLSDADLTSYSYSETTRVALNNSALAIESIKQSMPERHQFYRSNSYYSDPLTITFMKNVRILGGHVAVCTGIEHEFCVAESLGIGLRSEYGKKDSQVSIFRDGGSPVVRISSNYKTTKLAEGSKYLAIYLNPWNNYGHWHVHNLSFIEALKGILPSILRTLTVDRALFICPSLHDQHLRELKEFTVRRIGELCTMDIVSMDDLQSPLLVENFIISSSMSLDRGCRWPDVFRPLFAGARVSIADEAPKLIYCNRSHSGRRGVSNEEGLENALRAIGFQVIRPGELSFDKQREAFSNARVIMGSHGAALTNMVYSHFRPSIVELTHDHYGRTQYEWFQFMTAVMGGRYAPIIHPLDEQQRERAYYEIDLTADVDAALFQAEEAKRVFGIGCF